MFSVFREAEKKTRYEVYGRSYLREHHRFDLELVGGPVWLANLTEEIVTTMKESEKEGEQAYAELLVRKLESKGYL